MQRGRCPRHNASRTLLGARLQRLAPTIVAGLLLAGVVAALALLTLTARELSTQIELVRGDVARLSLELHATNERVEGQRELLSAQGDQQQEALRRITEAEAILESDVEIADIARMVRPSVFTVETAWAIGTGFVMSTRTGEAVVITNYHVVADLWRTGGREVTLHREEHALTGRIANVSVEHDLAVIVPSDALTPLDLERAPPEVGALVVAVGSPYGLEGTVSSGIVSAIREDRIQFSAPISPGNSGGPVVDESGAVVGVVVEKVAGVGYEGLSFAIPIDTVCLTVTSCEE
ncbi:MAG: hypothetical protein GEU80_10520 [Dehalococcoidia bacterium]|nr:hypothetical protein [Dehalococcoidia bacterium]